MALVYMDGMQDPIVAPKPEYVGAVWGSAVAGRDGSALGAATSPNTPKYLALTLGSSTVVMGFGLMVISGAQLGGTGMMISWSNGATPTWLLHMGVTAGGFLDFRRGTNYSGGTSLGITSGHDPIQLNVWRHLQIKYVAHVSAGTLVVRLDGVTVLNLTGVQTSNTTATPDRWHHNGGNNYGGGQWAIDDLWILDGTDGTSAQGRTNSDFLGDLKVSTLLPSTDGDLSQWTPSTGTALGALVVEVPPNTSDFNATSVSGNRDLYQVLDLAAYATAIYGLRLHFYGLKSDTGASSVKPLIKEFGGTITAQTAKPLSTTAASYSGEFVWSKPSAPGTPFAVADVNALQVGVELA